MSLIETRHTQVFPTLTAAQIAVARRFASGPERSFAANAVLFAVGDRPPAWLVLEGEVEIGLRDGTGHEHRAAMEGAGQFTGEVSQLTGRPSLAEAKAGPRGCLAQIQERLRGSSKPRTCLFPRGPVSCAYRPITTTTNPM